MARVSVVIPTYNRAALLQEAIESALSQTCGPVEVVVMDDGSTDATPAVAEKYADRVLWLRQQNRGVNAARNAAIAAASGEHVALLDSDDLLLPHALALNLSLLERFPNAAFAYGDFQVLRNGVIRAGSGLRAWHDAAHPLEDQFDRSWRFGELGIPLPAGLERGDFAVHLGDVYHASLFGPRVPTSGTLIRRRLMHELRFPEHDSLCGDWEFFARLSKRHGAVYADLPIMLNRSHEDAVRLTRMNSVTQLERRIALVDRVWREDGEFMSLHRAEVDSRQFGLLLTLLRNRLLAGATGEARAVIARAAPIRDGRDGLAWAMLGLAARVPGAPHAMRAARALRGHVWSWISGTRA